MFSKIQISIILITISKLCFGQEVYVARISTGINNEVQDLLSFQIPSGYDPEVPAPLLFCWHQYGAVAHEYIYVTRFDEECEDRGWIAASITGVSTTNWTNQLAQASAVSSLEYIESRYNIDRTRIYMVGASMGGGSGMIFSNNHLDPSGYMVAATASLSGIMDDYRRFEEQGYNTSMTNAFGGTPSEVPFEYQRNSPTYFESGGYSMHWNLKHLPVNLTVGFDDYPWVYHAMDMYDLLAPYADSVYYEQTLTLGHGWGIVNHGIICDWLSGFTLNDNPDNIVISADEPDVYYWTEVLETILSYKFAQYEAEYDTNSNYFHLGIIQNLSGIAMNLSYMGLNTSENLGFEINSQQYEECGIVLRDYLSQPSEILRDGITFDEWIYNPVSGEITFVTAGDHNFTILMNSEQEDFISEASVPRNKIILQSSANTNILEFELSLSGYGELSIFNILGQKIFFEKLNLTGQSSSFILNINDTAIPNGIYFCRLSSANVYQTKKIVLLK